MNIGLDQLVQAIRQQNVEPSLRSNAEAAVKEFADEIAKQKPDQGKIKRSLDVVMKLGKEFAVLLLVKVLENWDKIYGPHVTIHA